MLNWKFPAFLWLEGAILPVLLFYFLRMRFRRHPVSSIYIWSKLNSVIQGGNKLRHRSLFLLLFQLLAVTAAVMAVAQPSWTSRVRSQPSILYLVDRSASMMTMDQSGSASQTQPKAIQGIKFQTRSRFDAAKDYIKQEIGKLSPGTMMMVIGCASGIEPLGNPTTGHQEIVNRLAQMKPSYAAFSEAKVIDDLQTWMTVHKRAWRVVLITDGGLDLGGERLAVSMEGMLQTKIIGENGYNLGVTTLRVEFTPTEANATDSKSVVPDSKSVVPDSKSVGPKLGASDSDKKSNVTESEQLGSGESVSNSQNSGASSPASVGKARFLVHNGWPTERKIRVILYGMDEKKTYDLSQATLTVPPGNTYQTLEFKAQNQPPIYTIKIDQKPDQLPVDDSYSLAVNPPYKVKILAVGPENPFLKAALDNPQIELSRESDFPSVFTGEGWDLVIADQKRVSEGLRCNLLTFNSSIVSGPVQLGVPVAGTFEPARANHLLLRYIDWGLVQTSGGYALKTSPEVQVLATVGNQPVLAVWEKPDGWRRITFGTDLYHSNLGISGAFPIFMANLLQWIMPQFNNPLAYTLNVGESVTLAEPKDWSVMNTQLVEGKGIAKSLVIGKANMAKAELNGWKYVDTRQITEERQGSGKGPLVTLTGLTPGIFRWGRGRERGIIAVNTAPGEMDISPQPLKIPQSASHTTVGDFSAEIPLSSWMLALLLLALLAEWLLWRGLPQLK